MEPITTIRTLAPPIIASCTRIATQLSISTNEKKITDVRGLELLSIETKTLADVFGDIYSNELFASVSTSGPKRYPGSSETRDFAENTISIVQQCKARLESLENLLRECQGGKWRTALSGRIATRFNQANSEFMSYRHILKSYKEAIVLTSQIQK